MSKKSQWVESLRTMSIASLETELLTQRKNQFLLRMKAANEGLQKSHLVAETRKKVAQIKTILTEKKSVKVGEEDAN